jgi:hypothetical protein
MVNAVAVVVWNNAAMQYGSGHVDETHFVDIYWRTNLRFSRKSSRANHIH